MTDEWIMIKGPIFELWMVLYAPFGVIDSESKIMEFSEWKMAVIGKMTAKSMLKACYRDEYTIEIRVRDENDQRTQDMHKTERQRTTHP